MSPDFLAALPETTTVPTLTRAQIASLFFEGVVAEQDPTIVLRLLAAPGDAVLVVASDGRRWTITADGSHSLEEAAA